MGRNGCGNSELRVERLNSLLLRKEGAMWKYNEETGGRERLALAKNLQSEAKGVSFVGHL